jgi:hypothetical protein
VGDTLDIFILVDLSLRLEENLWKLEISKKKKIRQFIRWYESHF